MSTWPNCQIPFKWVIPPKPRPLLPAVFSWHKLRHLPLQSTSSLQRHRARTETDTANSELASSSGGRLGFVPRVLVRVSCTSASPNQTLRKLRSWTPTVLDYRPLDSDHYAGIRGTSSALTPVLYSEPRGAPDSQSPAGTTPQAVLPPHLRPPAARGARRELDLGQKQRNGV